MVSTGQGFKKKDGTFSPCSVQAGDVVLLPEYGGSNLKLDETNDYVLYRDEELLGVLKRE